MQSLEEKDQLSIEEQVLVKEKLEELTNAEKKIQKEIEKLKQKRIKVLKKISNPTLTILLLTGGTSLIKELLDYFVNTILNVITISLWGFLDAFVDLLKALFDRFINRKLKVFKVSEQEITQELRGLVRILKFLARYLPFIAGFIEAIPFVGDIVPAWGTSSLTIILLTIYISIKAKIEISKIKNGEKDEEFRNEILKI